MPRIRILPALCGVLTAMGVAHACYYSALNLENPSDYYYRYCNVGCTAIKPDDGNFASCCTPLPAGATAPATCAEMSSSNQAAGTTCQWGSVPTSDFPSSSYSYATPTDSGQAAMPTQSGDVNTVWVTSTTTTPCPASGVTAPPTTSAPDITDSPPTSSDCVCPQATDTASGDWRRNVQSSCSCDSQTPTDSGMAAVPTTSTTESYPESSSSADTDCTVCSASTDVPPPITETSSTDEVPPTSSSDAAVPTSSDLSSADQPSTSCDSTTAQPTSSSDAAVPTTSDSSTDQPTSSSDAAVPTTQDSTSQEEATDTPCTSSVLIQTYPTCTTSGCPSIGAVATDGNTGDYVKRDQPSACSGIGAVASAGATGDYGRRNVAGEGYAKREVPAVTITSYTTSWFTGTSYTCTETPTTDSGAAAVPTTSAPTTSSPSTPVVTPTSSATGVGAINPFGGFGDYEKRTAQPITVVQTVTSSTYTTISSCSATPTSSVCYCQSTPTTSSGMAAVPTSSAPITTDSSGSPTGIGAVEPITYDGRRVRRFERAYRRDQEEELRRDYNLVECPCDCGSVYTDGFAGQATTHSTQTVTTVMLVTPCSGATCSKTGATDSGSTDSSSSGATDSSSSGSSDSSSSGHALARALPKITAPPGWPQPPHKRAITPTGLGGDYKRVYPWKDIVQRDAEQQTVTSTTWITTDDCATSVTSSEAAQPTPTDGDEDCDDDSPTDGASATDTATSDAETPTTSATDAGTTPSSTDSGMAAEPTSSDVTTSESTPTSSDQESMPPPSVGAVDPTGDAGDYKRRVWR